MPDQLHMLDHKGLVFGHEIEDSFQLHPVASGSVLISLQTHLTRNRHRMRSHLDFLIRVGFVVLSSVGAHPRAQRMAPTDERATKPDQLVSAVNNNPGFVVQIPEGLYVNSRERIQFHPLIVPKSHLLAVQNCQRTSNPNRQVRP